MPQDQLNRLRLRVEELGEVVASFSRFGEEFRNMRKSTSPGPARDRVDEMIRLNDETLAVMKRNLADTETLLARVREAHQSD